MAAATTSSPALFQSAEGLVAGDDEIGSLKAAETSWKTGWRFGLEWDVANFNGA